MKIYNCINRKKVEKSGILLSLVLLLIGCSNQEKENDWTKNELEGKVKTYNHFSYEAEKRFGKIVKGKFEEGIGGGFLRKNHKTTFDRKRHKIEMYSYGSNDSSELESMWIYKYNEKGYNNETNRYDPDGGLITKRIYKYDENGNMIEKIMYRADGSLRDKYVYKYDKNGNRIEKSEYNSDEELKRKYIYKYDEKGNRIEKSKYKSDGNLRYKYIYKYDEEGNSIETSKYKSNESLDFKFTNKFDENGNKIESNKFNSEGSLKSEWNYEYQYDEQGNWIKKVGFENGTPTYIREREFEYYK